MPELRLPQNKLAGWGNIWLGTEGSIRNGLPTPKQPFRFDKKQGMDFAAFFDQGFAEAFAAMVDVPVRSRKEKNTNCVELGDVLVVGPGIKQNYDVGYGPNGRGPRMVFDSKTLNDRTSIGKNWRHMYHVLNGESAIVHDSYPYCLSSYIVVVPTPALDLTQQRDIISALRRLGIRQHRDDALHLAEAVALVIWNPYDGSINQDIPIEPNLRLDTLSQRIYRIYADRYGDTPPHI
jgi:hypothetical protein